MSRGWYSELDVQLEQAGVDPFNVVRDRDKALLLMTTQLAGAFETARLASAFWGDGKLPADLRPAAQGLQLDVWATLFFTWLGDRRTVSDCAGLRQISSTFSEARPWFQTALYLALTSAPHNYEAATRAVVTVERRRDRRPRGLRESIAGHERDLYQFRIAWERGFAHGEGEADRRAALAGLARQMLVRTE